MALKVDVSGIGICRTSPPQAVFIVSVKQERFEPWQVYRKFHSFVLLRDQLISHHPSIQTLPHFDVNNFTHEYIESARTYLDRWLQSLTSNTYILRMQSMYQFLCIDANMPPPYLEIFPSLDDSDQQEYDDELEMDEMFDDEEANWSPNEDRNTTTDEFDEVDSTHSGGGIHGARSMDDNAMDTMDTVFHSANHQQQQRGAAGGGGGAGGVSGGAGNSKFAARSPGTALLGRSQGSMMAAGSLSRHKPKKSRTDHSNNNHNNNNNNGMYGSHPGNRGSHMHNSSNNCNRNHGGGDDDDDDAKDIQSLSLVEAEFIYDQKDHQGNDETCFVEVTNTTLQVLSTSMNNSHISNQFGKGGGGAVAAPAGNFNNKNNNNNNSNSGKGGGVGAALMSNNNSNNNTSNSNSNSNSSGMPLPKRTISLEAFKIIKVIGKGSFGKVFLVRDKSKGILYAMKVLKKEYIIRKNQVEHTKTERSVLGQLRHPYIVGLNMAFQTQDKLFFVLDYCSGGELFFHLGKVGRFAEERAKFYAAQITLALEYVHQIGVIYRDLKPENVLLDALGNIRLTDFGLSKEGVSDHSKGANSFCGTPEYIAPEVLLRQGHGRAVDWWSLGALLYEMITGLPPFYSRNCETMFEKIMKADLSFPPTVSDPAKDLLKHLLVRDPQHRLGSGEEDAQEIKCHPFFVEMHWQELAQGKVPPPWVPSMVGSLDTSQFDQEFTSMMPIVSPDVRDAYFGSLDKAFEGFTFVDDSAAQYMTKAGISGGGGGGGGGSGSHHGAGVGGRHHHPSHHHGGGGGVSTNLASSIGNNRKISAGASTAAVMFTKKN